LDGFAQHNNLRNYAALLVDFAALCWQIFAALFGRILRRSTFYGITPNTICGITPHCWWILGRSVGYFLRRFLDGFCGVQHFTELRRTVVGFCGALLLDFAAHCGWILRRFLDGFCGVQHFTEFHQPYFTE